MLTLKKGLIGKRPYPVLASSEMSEGGEGAVYRVGCMVHSPTGEG